MLKLINWILLLAAVVMGIKQGYSMLAVKPEMLQMFGKWGFDKVIIMSIGLLTIISAVMIIFPKTFVWGNFLMASIILMIICLQLNDNDIKGAGIEAPFLLLNLLLIYLKHPLRL